MKMLPQVDSLSSIVVTAVAALVLGGLAPAQNLPCPGKHPGRANRVESVLKQGDSFMTQSLAGHVMKCAIARFQLEGLVSEADIKRTFDAKTRKGEMVNFLKFKFGSPSAVMPEFISNGHRHFDRGYSDEAAAIMLGLIRFEKAEPDFVIPDWLAKHVKMAVKEGTKEGISAFLQSYGVPGPLAVLIGEKIAARVEKQLPVSVSFPKKFDVDNRLIELAIEAKRKDAAQRRGQGASPGQGQATPKLQVPARVPGQLSNTGRKN